jgi:hypothetical protein
VQFGSVVAIGEDPLLGVSTWFTVGGNGFSPISGVYPLLPLGGTGLYVPPATTKFVDVTVALSLNVALPANSVLPLVLTTWSQVNSVSTSYSFSVPLINVPILLALTATGELKNVAALVPDGFHVGLRLDALSPALVAIIAAATIFLHFHN